MSEMIGRTLGPYRITEQLGMGGMATVYKAYQASMDRYVGVKVLPRHFAQDPTFVGRFEQEAKVIAKLEHARILPVYDYGEDDGVTYIVMRFLDAGTLSERIRAGRIPLEETARIIGQISEALDYAHKKGVIHRDIKPSNIMLDSNGDVYITDFGISKLIEGTAQFTGSGIVGTPDYVSPEQAMGKPADYRSDIYSLGIVLYQMATNDVPFHAETPMAVIIKHIHEPLPMPRSVNPDLPEGVEMVILKALAKDPDDRFQNCGELAKALKAAVAGKAVDISIPVHELPTSMPMATEIKPSPRPSASEAGTLPVMPAGASAPTQAAPIKQGKKRGANPIVLIGVAMVVIAVIVVGAIGFRALRQGQQAGRATSAALTAEVAATVGGTQEPVTGVNPTEAVTGLPGGPVEPVAGLPPSVKPIFADGFENNSFRPLWVLHQLPDDQIEFSPGTIGLPIVPGTGIFTGDGQPPSANVPMMLLELPVEARDKVYAIQVKVDFKPEHNFEGAGLVMLSERRIPVFSLMRAFCDREGICNGDAVYFDNWVAMGINTEGYHASFAGAGELPVGPIFVRIMRDERRVTGFFSLDGQDWQPVGEWQVGGDRLSFIGLLTTAGSQSVPENVAFFDDFVLFPPPAP